MSLESYIEQLAEREVETDSIANAVAKIQGRTPEQILADRERILGLTEAPRPIPEGQSLFDMLEGKWPSDESEEQIRTSLEKLS